MIKTKFKFFYFTFGFLSGFLTNHYYSLGNMTLLKVSEIDENNDGNIDFCEICRFMHKKIITTL